MLSNLFLILAGVLTGMWLRDANVALAYAWLPWLALLAFVLAVATQPHATEADSRVHLEEACHRWLDAWQRLGTVSERERAGAEEAMASAAHAIALTANDRVLKSLQVARERDLNVAAVAQLVLDMRRNLRRAGLTIRPAVLEALLAMPQRRVSSAPAAATDVTPSRSFLG
jgi:hypothetical protein